MYTQKKTESTVSVKLSANSFDKSTYVVRVPRNTITLDNLLTEISANYPSLDPYVIAHSAELLKHEILKQLKTGKAVNVLELGTMYLASNGTVPNTNPQVTDLPTLTLKFSPSKEAMASLSNVSVDSFMISDPTPQISMIESLKDGNTDGSLQAGFGVRLTGDKLKIGGTGAGIFFVPPGADGTPTFDESLWIAADTTYLPHNGAKKLEFSIPDTITVGTAYFIAVRTFITSGNIPRKEALTGFSQITVTVSE